MLGRLLNPAGVMALILAIMACALTAQSNAQDSESLDAIERRLIEHYNIREGNIAMRDAPGSIVFPTLPGSTKSCSLKPTADFAATAY